MNSTKLELCSRVAKKLENSRKLSANCLEAVFEVFMDEIFTIMAEGKNLELRGFGSFKTKIRKKRTGHNPRTKELIEIPAYKAPVFKFSKDGQRVFNKKIKESMPEKIMKKVLTVKEPVKEPVKESEKEIVIEPAISAIKTAESFSV